MDTIDADLAVSPYRAAREAAEVLAARTGIDRHDAVLVLGSAWSEALEGVGETVAELPMSDIPGLSVPGGRSHRQVLRTVRYAGRHLLVYYGRTHLYEGHSPDAVVHGIRTAAAAGCRTAVLTNLSGLVQPDWPVPAMVIISDHVNLTGASPLVGPPPADAPTFFTNLTDAYSPRLRAIARDVDPAAEEGTYVGFLGPQFETPAEIQLARLMGGSVVGMSTVLEVIAARHLGMEVLGVSLASNYGAGIHGLAVDPDDALRVGRAATVRMRTFLSGVLARLDEDAPSP